MRVNNALVNSLSFGLVGAHTLVVADHYPTLGIVEKLYVAKLRHPLLLIIVKLHREEIVPRPAAVARVAADDPRQLSTLQHIGPDIPHAIIP